MIPTKEEGLDALFEPDSPRGAIKQKEKKAQKPEKKPKKEKPASEASESQLPAEPGQPGNPKKGIVNQARYAKKQAKRAERAERVANRPNSDEETADAPDKPNPNIINFSNYVQTLTCSLLQEDLEELITVEECVEKISSCPRKFPQSVRLPPEIDNEGPTEYKLKLIDHSYDRMEHLVTQMKHRIDEGLGEAFYMLGYEDDGGNPGITKEDVLKSLRTRPSPRVHLLHELAAARDRQAPQSARGRTGQAAPALHQSHAEERHQARDHHHHARRVRRRQVFHRTRRVTRSECSRAASATTAKARRDSKC